MNFLVENWVYLLLIAMLMAHIILTLVGFGQLPKEEQNQRIRGWLLQAVILAEKTYGGGTGSLKLSAVYAAFCEQLPWLAKIVSFETFKNYVDDALDEMKHILASNKNIAGIVEDGGAA